MFVPVFVQTFLQMLVKLRVRHIVGHLHEYWRPISCLFSIRDCVNGHVEAEEFLLSFLVKAKFVLDAFVFLSGLVTSILLSINIVIADLWQILSILALMGTYLKFCTCSLLIRFLQLLSFFSITYVRLRRLSSGIQKVKKYRRN